MRKKEHKEPVLPETIRGFLIDIDGVLVTEDHPLPGAVEALSYLSKQRIPFLLLTNTTRKSRFSLQNNLQHLGYRISMEQIYTAPLAAARWLKQQKAKTIYLFLRGDAYREFRDFKITTANPEYLVIGDIGEDLSFEGLNNAFRMVMNGARMVALQKNRYWQRVDGLTIDAGPIVSALEFATGKKARLIGKPSPDFFRQALEQMGLPPEQVAVIGDDIDADIAGARKAGLFSILVKTGKYRDATLKRSRIRPDLILDSFARLPELLEKIQTNQEV